MSWEEGGVVLGRDLSDYSTKQLVEELSRREGVERIDVAPHTQVIETCVSGFLGQEVQFPVKYLYDSKVDGPCIILNVID